MSLSACGACECSCIVAMPCKIGAGCFACSGGLLVFGLVLLLLLLCVFHPESLHRQPKWPDVGKEHEVDYDTPRLSERHAARVNIPCGFVGSHRNRYEIGIAARHVQRACQRRASVMRSSSPDSGSAFQGRRGNGTGNPQAWQDDVAEI